MNINMQPVKSSQIETIGHDPDTVTMAVKFKSGAVYHYSGVDAAIFANMCEAESVSEYFNKYIKPYPDRFPYQKQEKIVPTQVKRTVEGTTKQYMEKMSPSPVMPAMVEFKPEEFNDVLARADNLVQQAGRMEVAKQEDFAKGGDLVKLLRSVKAELEDARTQRVKPHNDYARDLNGWFKPHTTALDTAVDTAIGKMNVWQRAENARLAEEQRKAREKLEAEAVTQAEQLEKSGKTEEAEKVIQKAIDIPAPEVKVSKVRGAYGSVAGTKKVWRVKVLDIKSLPDACINAIMTNDRAMDAIRLALKPLTDAAIASKQTDIPGLSIKQEEETNVR